MTPRAFLGAAHEHQGDDPCGRGRPATISALTAAAAIAGLGGPLMACLAILAVLICPGAAPAISLRPWLGAGEAAVAAVAERQSGRGDRGSDVRRRHRSDQDESCDRPGLGDRPRRGPRDLAPPRGGNGWSISLRFRRSGWIAAAIATLLLAGTVVVTVRGVDSASFPGVHAGVGRLGDGQRRTDDQRPQSRRSA